MGGWSRESESAPPLQFVRVAADRCSPGDLFGFLRCRLTMAEEQLQRPGWSARLLTARRARPERVSAVAASAAATSSTTSPGSCTCTSLIGFMYGTTPPAGRRVPLLRRHHPSECDARPGAPRRARRSGMRKFTSATDCRGVREERDVPAVAASVSQLGVVAVFPQECGSRRARRTATLPSSGPRPRRRWRLPSLPVPTPSKPSARTETPRPQPRLHHSRRYGPRQREPSARPGAVRADQHHDAHPLCTSTAPLAPTTTATAKKRAATPAPP